MVRLRSAYVRSSRSSARPMPIRALSWNCSPRRVVRRVRPLTRLHRRALQGPLGDRAEHADRLLGLPRLERTRWPVLALQRPSESLFAYARRPRRLYAAGDRQRRGRRRSAAIITWQYRIRRDQGVPSRDRWRDVGTGDDDAVRQADQCFGRRQQGVDGQPMAKSGSARFRNRFRSRSGAAKIAAANWSTTTSCAIS